MTLKRYELKVTEIFDKDDNGNIAILRMLAACNDLNAIALLFIDKKVHTQFEIKEIREGIHTYLFRILISHLIEAKNGFSSFSSSSFGKEILRKLKEHSVWKETSEHYERLVSFFEKPNELFKLAQEKIRTGVGFHYQDKDFKEALGGEEGQKKSLIVIGETNKETRYSFVDDLIASRIAEVLKFDEAKYDEITKPIGSLNQFCNALLTIILIEKQDKIKEIT